MRAHQSGALQQFVARGGKDAALGNGAVPVAGASDALPGDRDRARRSDLANQIHRADIDSEFERSRGDQSSDFARLQPPFGVEPQLPRQASVMGGHSVAAKPFRQVMRHSLRQTAGVHEDQRGAMLAHELRDAVVDFIPHLMRRDRAQFAGGNFDGKVELALVADLHDRRDPAGRFP